MNSHLNLFHFFNDHDAAYLEDNLSRAFALCLQHDPVFLDQVVLEILQPTDYHRLRRALPDWQTVVIDLQQPAKDLGGYDHLYALSVTAGEIDWPVGAESEINGSLNPITDLTVALGDTLLVFEFKRTAANCADQLRGQVTAIQRANDADDIGRAKVTFTDFSWMKLLRLAEQRAAIDSKAALFPRELVRFVENHYPEFFPTLPLHQLSFTDQEDTTALVRIEKRLDYLKEMLGQRPDFTFEAYTGTYRRTNLRVAWGWTREVLLGADLGQGGQLVFTVYGGETKRQGYELFTPSFSFGELVERGARQKLVVAPFLKWRHFNSRIADWFVDQEIASTTHTPSFFQRYAGRHKRTNWETPQSLEQQLDAFHSGWRTKSGYTKTLTNSNRNYYDFSIGVRLQLRVPYAEAQAMERKGEGAVLDWLQAKIEDLRACIRYGK